MASYVLNITCSPYNNSDHRNIRVQIKCLAADDSSIDTAIFAYRYIAGEFVFDHVCSTVDMVDYINADKIPAANTGESFIWCRKDTLDLLVRTLSIAEDLIEEVKSDVRQLYANMKIHNTIVGVENYPVGTLPTYIAVDENSEGYTNRIVSLPLASYIVFNNKTLRDGTLSEVVTDENRSLYYEPSLNTFGTDSFTYTVVDINGAKTTYSVAVDIKPNATKGFVQQIDHVYGSVDISYTDLNLAPWLDPNKPWTMTTMQEESRHGIITVKDDTTLTYTAKPGDEYVGDDDFDYKVTDRTHTAIIHCTVYKYE